MIAKILKVFSIVLCIILELLSFVLFAYTVSLRVPAFPWSDSVSAGFSILLVHPILFVIQVIIAIIFWNLNVSKSFQLPRKFAVVSTMNLIFICTDFFNAAAVYSYYYPYAIVTVIATMLLALYFVWSVGVWVVKKILTHNKPGDAGVAGTRNG